jgi:ribosomal protein S18 acetylase RimI-like enzyme
MRVYAIDQNGLHAIAAIDPEYPGGEEGFRQLLEQMWTRGESWPDWCFIVEVNGHSTGRIVYWTLQHLPHELRFLGLHLPWHGDYMQVGKQLLRESLQQIEPSGVKTLVRELAPHWNYVAEQQAVLEAAGLSLIQKRVTYHRSGELPTGIENSRLAYRTFREAGEEAFLDAIARTTRDTLDEVIRWQLRTFGELQTAKLMLQELAGECNQELGVWQLALDRSGELVGLFVATMLQEEQGALCYLGVVPEQRGQGYVNDLLHDATRRLIRQGATRIGAQADERNVPIRLAFERAGYWPESEVVRRYQAPLSQFRE